MSGVIVLLVLLILLACYGLYTVSHLLLRRLLPYKPNATFYLSLGIAFCFFAVFALSATSAITQIRSQAFEQGRAEATVASEDNQQTASTDTTQLYTSAYTQGYTDAIDEYINRILVSALEDAYPLDSQSGVQESELQDPIDEESEMGRTDDTNAPQVSAQNPGSQGEDNASIETDSIPETGTTVYYTSSGSVLHLRRDCSYLKNSSEILSCDLSEAPDRPLCSRCG